MMLRISYLTAKQKFPLLIVFLTVYTVLISSLIAYIALTKNASYGSMTGFALRITKKKQFNNVTAAIKESECLYANNSYGIYFVEMLKEDGLSLREACAIESAAILHPTRDIILLHSIPFQELNNHTTAVIKNNFNIRLTPLNFTELFIGTPLQEWHLQDRINTSIYRTEHTSDAVRYALLWRCGGIYSDTDAISIHSYNGLHNAIGYSAGYLAGGIMIFDRGHPFIMACMVELAKNFDPTNYSANGPFLVSRVMKSFCSRSDLLGLVNRPQECRGVTIMEDFAFYPFDWSHENELFKNKSSSKVSLSKSFSVHLYGKRSRNVFAKLDKLSLLETIARRQCPKTFEFIKVSKFV